MMTALAIAIALFVWWFSTGAILWLAMRSPIGGRAAITVTAPLAALAVLGLARGAQMPGIEGAYLGFAAAIGLWGWVELTFLTGALTGPNRAPCPPGAAGFDRFRAAWSAVAHHEALLAGLMAVLLWSLWGAENPTGIYTFATLFVARLSAKLNIYLGVPHLSHSMLPAAVSHLKTYFRERRVTALYPVSITFLTLATVCWIERAMAMPTGSGAETGFILLASLTALALLEHWLMAVPLRDSALWRWAGARLEPHGPAQSALD